MEKETSRKNSKLITILAGVTLSAVAVLASGCDVVAGYRYNRGFYPSPYHRRVIVSPPIYRNPSRGGRRIITPRSRPFNNGPYRSPNRSPSRDNNRR